MLLKVNAVQPEGDVIRQAAEVIRRGGLVAFPTETVYGLGADALNEVAVARIFIAKDRPAEDPVIVHIASIEDLRRVARDLPPQVPALSQVFWPGPLTLILLRAEAVPASVAAGLDTVGVHMPGHPVALALICAAGTPIAAPSANLFGRPSPTTAQHVLEDLGEQVELILDGGSTLHRPGIHRAGPFWQEADHPAARGNQPRGSEPGAGGNRRRHQCFLAGP